MEKAWICKSMSLHSTFTLKLITTSLLFVLSIEKLLKSKTLFLTGGLDIGNSLYCCQYYFIFTVTRKPLLPFMEDVLTESLRKVQGKLFLPAHSSGRQPGRRNCSFYENFKNHLCGLLSTLGSCHNLNVPMSKLEKLF